MRSLGKKISRWCKSLLNSAGIDIEEFGCHSTRAASTSFAALKAGDISNIIESVGWSNVQTFQTFYNKPINTSFNFGSSVMNAIDKV